MCYTDLNRQCPGVAPRLHGFLALEGHAVLFLELAAAGSMAPLLQQLGEKGCAYVAACLARIIMAVKVAGWQHSDIKPANLLLQPDGMVLLGDLNIATRLEGDGHAYGTSGTAYYMAPEHQDKAADGKRNYRAEFFSAGMTLYSLAADCNAWSAAGLRALRGLLDVRAAKRVTGAHPAFRAWMRRFD